MSEGVRRLQARPQKVSDESADDCRAECRPAVVVIVVMVVDIVVAVMTCFRSRAVMVVSFGGVVSGGWDAFCGLMPWRRGGGVAFAAARRCNGCSAERHTGKSENQKLFESLVHSAPSLSF